MACRVCKVNGAKMCGECPLEDVCGLCLMPSSGHPSERDMDCDERSTDAKGAHGGDTRR